MTIEFEQQVRTRAYEIWEREGYPDGRALDHWEQAAHEVDRLLCAMVAPVIEAPVIAAPVMATPVMADAVKAAPAKKSPKKVAAPAAKAPRRSTRAHQSLN